jgi:hypothetical protein
VIHPHHHRRCCSTESRLHFVACRTFDNKLGRRRFGEYAENYSHDGDSGGIHASGAGFEKMDPAEAWRPPVY